MCGIFGAVSLRDPFEAEDHQRFVGLTDLAAYRGPDDFDYRCYRKGRWEPVQPNSFDLFFGHRRLSIIELSEKGRQPFHDGDGRWIIYNGEVFNYLELREELRSVGVRFRTETDTEVILRAFAEWGPRAFGRLNGMWAFALLDQNQRRLWLCRDRFSIKPLYTLEQNGRLYFASEIKQLLPLLSSRKPNVRNLSSFLSQGIAEHNPETFFEGIRKVRPMACISLNLEDGSREEIQYWGYTPEPTFTWKEACERFADLLLDSIQIRLRSDVPVGALLSGGLDSSAICVLANRRLESGLSSYSVVSRDQAFSEEPFVDLLSAEGGVRNTKLYLEPGRVRDNLENVLNHQDEPFRGFSVVAQYQVYEKIRQETDITVVLSGQGGDEVLAGYLKYYYFHLAQAARRGKILTLAREVLASLWNRTVLHQFSPRAARRYLPFGLGNKTADWCLADGHAEGIGGGRTQQERQKLDLDRFSVPLLARYEDRNSMAHSLEVRHPFLDHRLVNFLVHLPAEFKVRNGWTKYILRRSLVDLPGGIRWRRDKQGFITPEERWLKEEFRAGFESLFTGSLLGRMGVVDEVSVRNAFRRFEEGDRLISSADMTQLLVSEMWARKHFG